MPFKSPVQQKVATSKKKQSYIDSLYGNVQQQMTPAPKPKTSSTYGTDAVSRQTVPPFVTPLPSISHGPDGSVTPLPTYNNPGGGGTVAGNSTTPQLGGTPQGQVQYQGDPATGWAKPYRPDYYSNVLNDPSILATDVLKTLGINSPGLANDLGQQGQLGALLGFIQNPNGGYGNNAEINYMGDYIKQLMTPGGSMPNTHDLVSAILNTAQDPNNPLYSYLTTGNDGLALTPEQQYTRINSAIEAAVSNMSPYMQIATQGALGQAQKSYAGSMARGTANTPDNYLAYLRGQGLGNYY